MPRMDDSSDRVGPPEIDVRRYIDDMAIDLKLVLAFILVMLVFIYIPYLNATFIRPALGIVMVLFTPGYALIAALFPGKHDLGRVERASLSLGLSIAVSSLIGLGLNYTPWGIRIDPLAVCLSLFTITSVLIANKRRHNLTEDERFSVSIKSVRTALREEVLPITDNKLERSLNFAIIALVLLSIGLTIFVLAVPKQGEKFTEFYVLGTTGKTENYPMEFYLGETKPIVVGIVNHEYVNATYNIVARISDNTSVYTLYSHQVTLSNEQKWEQTVELTPDRTGTGMRLEFLLYRDGNMTSPYRDLHLWVNVSNSVI